MTLFAATTHVRLLSPGPSDSSGSPDTPAGDWGSAPDRDTGYTPVGDPVRAHLSGPSGNGTTDSEGSSAALAWTLLADPCPITTDMLVEDVFDGAVYNVDWCANRPEPLAHVVAGISLVVSSA